MFVKKPKEFFPPSFLFSHSARPLLSSPVRFFSLRGRPLSSLHRKSNGFIFRDSSVFHPFLLSSSPILFLSLSSASELLAVEVIRFGANPAKLIRLQVAFTPAGKRSQHCRELDGLLDTDHPHWLYNLQHKALRRGNWKARVKKRKLPKEEFLRRENKKGQWRERKTVAARLENVFGEARSVAVAIRVHCFVQ